MYHLSYWKDVILVSILQRNRANKMYIGEEIYYKESAHMTMTAEKSQEPQSASWGHRRADGVVPVGRLAELRLRKN